jgi:cysteine desulfurase
MLAAMDHAGNASSVHGEGRAARKVMDDAREQLAFALGCLPQMMTFTSGGTEANATALLGVGAEHFVVSATEHPSVLETVKASGKPFDLVPVDGNGVVDLAALDGLLGRANTLVSVMAANNETGVLQPMAEISASVRAKGALLHVDASQAFMKHPVNFGLLGCDLMTVTAHKAGGPQGVGALVVRDGIALTPLLLGGGQELRRRAGTENIAAIAGFGALAQEPVLEASGLRDTLESGLGDAIIFSRDAQRLSNTSCLAIPGLRAETLLMNLDLAGFAVSSGSACSSGKVGRSHVLEAMGVAPDIAACAIRVSTGWSTTGANISAFIETVKKLRARASARRAA